MFHSPFKHRSRIQLFQCDVVDAFPMSLDVFRRWCPGMKGALEQNSDVALTQGDGLIVPGAGYQSGMRHRFETASALIIVAGLAGIADI
ncbi:MAG TPA: hypothetical protein VGZ73_15650 [Bryobacteraceae bacterium]|nr:hypothetical protein [Bryobacteraceae bacterium]